MSGEVQSQNTIKDRLDKVDSAISEVYDKYDIDKSVFIMDIGKASDEECQQRSLSLSGTNYMMQLEFNRLKSKYNFLETLLNRHLYPELKQYSGSWNEKYYKALNDNNYCKTIHNEMIVFKVKMDALEYVSRRIESFIEILMEVSRSKRGK